MRVRPKFEAALEACRQIKAYAPHCRVILTVYEMKRLGRDSAELTALADYLTAHGVAHDRRQRYPEAVAGPRRPRRVPGSHLTGPAARPRLVGLFPGIASPPGPHRNRPGR